MTDMYTPMKPSIEGIIELILHEGVVVAPYYDSVDVRTYGVGITRYAYPGLETMPHPGVHDLDAVSNTKRRALLTSAISLSLKCLERYTDEVNAAVRTAPRQLTQHEFDALWSFHINTGGIGRAKLTAYICSDAFVSDKDDIRRKRIASKFRGWLRPPELRKRREREIALFNDSAYASMSGQNTLAMLTSSANFRLLRPAKAVPYEEMHEIVTAIVHPEENSRSVPWYVKLLNLVARLLSKKGA